VNGEIVVANGVELCVEGFGDPSDPAILLIAGATSSMLFWDDELCHRLAAGSRFVIRYDNRDTGRSITYQPGAPRYSGVDLVEDAVGLVDTFGLAAAHLVGVSMGAGIAQVAALEYPDLVASLTLISTSPAAPGAQDLPPMSEELRAHFAEAKTEPDWSDREAVIDYLVEDARPYSGKSRPFDEEDWRMLAARDFDRSINLESSLKNHFVIDGGEESRRSLGEIAVPTLVVHGDEDPLFPVGHAEALAREIPDAELLVLEGTGHELPRAVWDVVVPAILRHTGQARRGLKKSRRS
jgi:pimeloyl-ACP methyl ester carboxylesterase